MVQRNLRHQQELIPLGSTEGKGKEFVLKTIEKDSVKNPLPGYIFLLRVDAVYDLACTKVSGIVQEKEYENIVEGGVNDYVQLREKPSSKPNILQVERYIGERYLDPLPVGKRCEIPLVLYVDRHLDFFVNAPMIFTFSGCTVMSKKYGDLDAEHSGLMTETIQIAYQQVAVEKRANEIVMPLWGFDQSGQKYQGTGLRRATYDKNEVRKKDMEEMSRKWPRKRSAKT